MWTPCNSTPTHSLTGPVGQPFASCLGGQRFAFWGCTHSHNGTGFLPLALVSLHYTYYFLNFLSSYSCPIITIYTSQKRTVLLHVLLYYHTSSPKLYCSPKQQGYPSSYQNTSLTFFQNSPIFSFLSKGQNN